MDKTKAYNIDCMEYMATLPDKAFDLGIVKNILMILMLVVFSPIVLLESWFNKVKWEIRI